LSRVEIGKGEVAKFVAHSSKVLSIACRFGWMPAARYTNLRDVREFSYLGFLDICWRDYSFKKHLEAAKSTRPIMTVAHDIENVNHLERVLDQAWQLNEYSDHVVVVPKDRRLGPDLSEIIPPGFLLGYSVPTKYGATDVPSEWFRRPTHLLGGRPDIQRKLATQMPVVSFDCNRFTYDARFGDYFDGEKFRPHPVGGYERCIVDSIRNIDQLWESYSPKERDLSIKEAKTWTKTRTV